MKCQLAVSFMFKVDKMQGQNFLKLILMTGEKYTIYTVHKFSSSNISMKISLQTTYLPKNQLHL